MSLNKGLLASVYALGQVRPVCYASTVDEGISQCLQGWNSFVGVSTIFSRVVSSFESLTRNLCGIYVCFLISFGVSRLFFFFTTNFLLWCYFYGRADVSAMFSTVRERERDRVF